MSISARVRDRCQEAVEHVLALVPPVLHLLHPRPHVPHRVHHVPRRLHRPAVGAQAGRVPEPAEVLRDGPPHRPPVGQRGHARPVLRPAAEQRQVPGAPALQQAPVRRQLRQALVHHLRVRGRVHDHLPPQLPVKPLVRGQVRVADPVQDARLERGRGRRRSPERRAQVVRAGAHQPGQERHRAARHRLRQQLPGHAVQVDDAQPARSPGQRPGGRALAVRLRPRLVPPLHPANGAPRPPMQLRRDQLLRLSVPGHGHLPRCAAGFGIEHATAGQHWLGARGLAPGRTLAAPASDTVQLSTA